MPKCIACGEEYADEKQHLIDRHNVYKSDKLGTVTLGDLEYGLPPLPDIPGIEYIEINKRLMKEPSLLTEIAYYLGLVCLFLAGFIFGNILMFAYLIIIQ